MNVEIILRHKGDKVVTVGPDTAIADAVRRLEAEKIGALVVGEEGGEPVGILSERDVVAALARHGAELLRMRVSELMTRPVRTCRMGDDIGYLMAEMTQHRVRHLPVVEDGRLCGIVSIGDVVKRRLDELELETTVMRDYISGR